MPVKNIAIETNSLLDFILKLQKCERKNNNDFDAIPVFKATRLTFQQCSYAEEIPALSPLPDNVFENEVVIKTYELKDIFNFRCVSKKWYSLFYHSYAVQETQPSLQASENIEQKSILQDEGRFNLDKMRL